MFINNRHTFDDVKSQNTAMMGSALAFHGGNDASLACSADAAAVHREKVCGPLGPRRRVRSFIDERLSERRFAERKACLARRAGCEARSSLATVVAVIVIAPASARKDRKRTSKLKPRKTSGTTARHDQTSLGPANRCAESAAQ